MTDKKITFKIKLLSLTLIIFLLGLDQLIKQIIVFYLKDAPPYLLVKGVLQFRYLENDGAMLGLMEGKTLFMTVAALACVAVMLVVVFSGIIKDKINYFCAVFMIAGGIGNVIDRVFRGFVVDYIEVLFVDFYVFNFADCLITVSAFLLIFYQIYLMIKEAKEKKQVKNNG